jgi:hypothetical protein
VRAGCCRAAFAGLLSCPLSGLNQRSFFLLLFLFHFAFGFLHVVSSCSSSAWTRQDDAEVVVAQTTSTQLPLELARLHRAVLQCVACEMAKHDDLSGGEERREEEPRPKYLSPFVRG